MKVVLIRNFKTSKPQKLRNSKTQNFWISEALNF